jgi:hypothetical protein
MPASIQNSSDSELVHFAQQMLTAISADPAAYGLTAAFVTELSARIDQFKTDIREQAAAQAKARSTTAAKNTSRDSLEEYMRSGRNVTKASGTSAAMIAALGLPSAYTKAPPSATVPFGSVDTSARLRHKISWTDAAAPDNKRRPRGVLGCEIWVKVGDPMPGSEKDCRFLTIDASTPYVAEFEGADVGQTAHYLLRWRRRDGTTSAWSETISATITG